ncbi:MAG: hypothetical protein MI799_14255 [Desulfobacterales bacterium]|nr:hypothetical protein [Desulfobacterales bacterium]
MIRIDDLVIELPAELGSKAGRIARLVREKSAGLRINYQDAHCRGRVEAMALGDIEIKMPANDNTIAEQIVSRIEQSLKKRG